MKRVVEFVRTLRVLVKSGIVAYPLATTPVAITMFVMPKLWPALSENWIEQIVAIPSNVPTGAQPPASLPGRGFRSLRVNLPSTLKAQRAQSIPNRKFSSRLLHSLLLWLPTHRFDKRSKEVSNFEE